MDWEFDYIFDESLPIFNWRIRLLYTKNTRGYLEQEPRAFRIFERLQFPIRGTFRPYQQVCFPPWHLGVSSSYLELNSGHSLDRQLLSLSCLGYLFKLFLGNGKFYLDLGKKASVKVIRLSFHHFFFSNIYLK